MANREQLARLKASIAENSGCASWNRWCIENWIGGKRNYRSTIDLIGADLRGTDLHYVNLKYVNLCRANLVNANLRGADLTGADLRGADLSSADLTRSDFSNANLDEANLGSVKLRDTNLSNANLKDANLSSAHLKDTKLTCANFTNAQISYTTFNNIDLRGVIGLVAMKHKGPSHLAIDTLYKSHGEIPDIFLRGCGVPDSMIEFAHALVNAENPIDYYSCFISYNTQDEAFAQRLYSDLQSRSVRCWFAPEHMRIGDKIRHRVDESIRVYDKLLVVLSEHSLQSEWVEYEVEMAMTKERKEHRTVLFPVRIDDSIKAVTGSWADYLRTRHIGVFDDWKQHDAYQVAFDRLLRDLKADSR